MYPNALLIPSSYFHFLKLHSINDFIPFLASQFSVVGAE
jgi:hypothetical protein